MQITTKSGAVYYGSISPMGTLMVSKGKEPVSAVGIFPNRLPFFKATVKWVYEGTKGVLQGYNAKGTRTIKVEPHKVLPGMILVNPRGLRSTEVVSVD